MGPWIELDVDITPEMLKPGTILGNEWQAGRFVRYRQLLDAVGYVEAKRHRDVREYLQGLGTEVGRDMIDPEVWVTIAERTIRGLLESGHNVVITAVRFPNELEMITRLGGTSIWIERASEARGAAEELSGHASETSVSQEQFDWGIDNNRTLPELYDTVESVLDIIEQAQLRVGPKLRLGPTGNVWPVYDR
jgi:hypothetical protein